MTTVTHITAPTIAFSRSFLFFCTMLSKICRGFSSVKCASPSLMVFQSRRSCICYDVQILCLCHYAVSKIWGPDSRHNMRPSCNFQVVPHRPLRSPDVDLRPFVWLLKPITALNHTRLTYSLCPKFVFLPILTTALCDLNTWLKYLWPLTLSVPGFYLP